MEVFTFFMLSSGRTKKLSIRNPIMASTEPIIGLEKFDSTLLSLLDPPSQIDSKFPLRHSTYIKLSLLHKLSLDAEISFFPSDVAYSRCDGKSNCYPSLLHFIAVKRVVPCIMHKTDITHLEKWNRIGHRAWLMSTEWNLRRWNRHRRHHRQFLSSPRKVFHINRMR